VPHLQASFSSQAVLSTGLLGKRTDFHERSAPAAAVLRPHLLGAGIRRSQDFDDDAAANPVVKEHVDQPR
jgi:hypothetical protein